MGNGQRILVAMSGGVDSSVAACLLKEQGYDVVGVFMRLGNEPAAAEGDACTETGLAGAAVVDAGSFAAGAGPVPISPSDPPSDGRERKQSRSLPVRSSDGRSDRHRGCCSAVDATDARAVAGKLGIPFYALNFAEDFARLIDYFADEYAAARTPNPCVMCNQWLKFGRLLAYAEVVEADLVATGHYARVDHEGPRLRRARDASKDQSYVLFGVPPDVLRRTRFPLGDLSKDEVRAHARRFGLTVHDKPESQDICFAPDRDYAKVVRTRRPEAFRSGHIQHVDGRILGEHAGLANFTVGQRRGLRVAAGHPLYVTALNAATNTVVVGTRHDVLSHGAMVSDVSWFGAAPTRPLRADVKIRYNHQAVPSTVLCSKEGDFQVDFDVPQTAVTPGQAAVFYDGDMVLGGGWITGPARIAAP